MCRSSSFWSAFYSAASSVSLLAAASAFLLVAADPIEREGRQNFAFQTPAACLPNVKEFYRNPLRSKESEKDVLDNCVEFFRCSGGTVFRMSCASSTRFNVITQVCENAIQVTTENCNYDTQICALELGPNKTSVRSRYTSVPTPCCYIASLLEILYGEICEICDETDDDYKPKTTPRPLLDSSKCQANELSCANGVCLDKLRFCDNVPDCDDGSDEGFCGPGEDPNSAPVCDEQECVLPDCFCSKKGTKIPDGILANQIPQMVLLQFDDAINDQNFPKYAEILTKERTNPGGQCRIKATFFIQHAYTNYRYVEQLHKQGHEIALKAVDQDKGESFWSKAPKERWVQWIIDNKKIISKFGRIDPDKLKGMRAPYFSPGGNAQYEMMREFRLVWDSSIGVPPIAGTSGKEAMWPYTLDYRIPHDCYPKAQKQCPTRSFKGIWEVPLNPITGALGETCSTVSQCHPFEDPAEVVDMLNTNLEKRYEGNRAPLVFSFNTNWLSIDEHFQGLKQWLDSILNGRRNDVYFVTTSQLIAWMQNPTPITSIPQFEPWQCAQTFAFGAEQDEGVCSAEEVHGCNLEGIDAAHRPGFMFTCVDCPKFYPDVGVPDGESLASGTTSGPPGTVRADGGVPKLNTATTKPAAVAPLASAAAPSRRRPTPAAPPQAAASAAAASAKQQFQALTAAGRRRAARPVAAAAAAPPAAQAAVEQPADTPLTVELPQGAAPATVSLQTV